MTTILTLNAGLIRLSLFGIPFFEPAPLIPQRFAGLAESLRDQGADIVALQEIYRRPHKQALAEALFDMYPHAAIPARPARPLLDSGLMLLSKFPVRDFVLNRFRAGTPEERRLTWRGWMSGWIDTPDLGSIRLLNYHTTAGGLHRDPEADLQNARRSAQIDEILSDADAHEDADVIVLTGDLNAGPPASLENYRQILRAGYLDTYAPNGERKSPPYVTWDSRQPLNVKGPHNFQKAQRIDQIFVRRADADRLNIHESQCVLHEPRIETARGPVSVSDHYGVQATVAPGGA